MNEKWLDIKGYEGLYMVSDQGRVKSLWFNKEQILKSNINRGGYHQVILYKDRKRKNKTVHKLVCCAFIGDSALHCDHINGIKTDNRSINLRHLTNRENITAYTIKQKTSSQYTGVSWSKQYKTWRAYITINGKLQHLGNFKLEHTAHLAYQSKLSTL